MKSRWIEALRSVALTVPDLKAAEAFYTQVWRLGAAARSDGAIYLRGSRPDHHLLALHAAPGTPTIRLVTLRARSAGALEAIAVATMAAGGVVERAMSDALDPAGGQALLIRDACGRRIQIVHADTRRTPDAPAPPDQPGAPGSRGAQLPRHRGHPGPFLSRRSALCWPTARGSWPS